MPAATAIARACGSIMTSGKKDTPNRWGSHAEEVADLAARIRKWVDAGWIEAYAAVPDLETLSVLRRIDAAIPQEPTLTLLRVRCLQTVASCSLLWQRATTDEQRRIALVTFAHNLRAADTRLWSPPLPPTPSAPGWSEAPSPQPIEFDGLDSLAELAEKYSPSPRFKDGARGAESILAEIIVVFAEPGALGFDKASKDGDEESLIDDVRKHLANDAAPYLNIKKSEK